LTNVLTSGARLGPGRPPHLNDSPDLHGRVTRIAGTVRPTRLNDPPASAQRVAGVPGARAGLKLTDHRPHLVTARGALERVARPDRRLRVGRRNRPADPLQHLACITPTGKCITVTGCVHHCDRAPALPKRLPARDLTSGVESNGCRRKTDSRKSRGSLVWVTRVVIPGHSSRQGPHATRSLTPRDPAVGGTRLLDPGYVGRLVWSGDQAG
jgi:hypothetical protein